MVVSAPVIVLAMTTSPLKIRLEGPPVPVLADAPEPMNLNVMVDKLLKLVAGSVIDEAEPELNVPIDVA